MVLLGAAPKAIPQMWQTMLVPLPPHPLNPRMLDLVHPSH